MSRSLAMVKVPQKHKGHAHAPDGPCTRSYDSSQASSCYERCEKCGWFMGVHTPAKRATICEVIHCVAARRTHPSMSTNQME